MMGLPLPWSILHFTAFLLTGIYNYSSVSATGAPFTETTCEREEVQELRWRTRKHAWIMCCTLVGLVRMMDERAAEK